MTCPECGAAAERVIYLGAPMSFCEECTTLWGFWSWLPAFVPIVPDGGWVFMVYRGSYLAALWRWLRDDVEAVR